MRYSDINLDDSYESMPCVSITLTKDPSGEAFDLNALIMVMNKMDEPDTYALLIKGDDPLLPSVIEDVTSVVAFSKLFFTKKKVLVFTSIDYSADASECELFGYVDDVIKITREQPD